jgi:hypothetical protein
MLFLTIVGVVGIVVYSYKMSRTPVYPVGIVRKPPETQPIAPSTVVGKASVVTEPKPDVVPELKFGLLHGDLDFEDYIVRDLKKRGLKAQKIAQTVGQAKDLGDLILCIDDVPISVWTDMSGGGWWTCPNCKLVQKYEKEARCASCSFALDADTNVTMGVETTKASALQDQLSQQHQALQDMDKRIRELEKESITKKTAEIMREEEKRQDWVQ